MANDLVAVEKRSLTAAQYGDLAEVPPEFEWLANITNPKTRRAYKIDVSEFSAFAGLRGPAKLRTVTRAHVTAADDLPGFDVGSLTACRIHRYKGVKVQKRLDTDLDNFPVHYVP